MKRYVKSYTEPSATEYGKFLQERQAKMQDRFEPFLVRDSYLDRWSVNKTSYRITLDDSEWIAWYNDVNRYDDKPWELYGDFYPGSIKSSSQLSKDKKFTDRKFSSINEIMTYLFTELEV